MQRSSPDDITDPMHILFSFHPKEEEVEKAHSGPTTSPHQGATAPVSRGEPASSPPEAMAIAPATSSEDFVSEVYAFGDVEVVAVRPRAWPEETSTADCDETGRVAWRAQPTLCAYLSSKRGRREVIASRRRVRELGCGLGIPGILCWRLGAKEVELTDGNAGVVKDLKLAIAENEARAGSARVGLGKITARELAWGSDGTMDWSEEGKWEMIVASDVVYSATSASGVLECVERTLSLTDGLFVLAYVSRWPNVDRALYDAVVSTGFDATLIPLATFTQEESLEELSDRPCLFALRRSVDRAMGCFTAEDPNVCGVSREWFVEETGRLVVTPIDALTETFGTDLDVLLQSHASNIKMLEINAKGPFKLDRNVIQVLFSTLEKHATLLNLVEIEDC
jgi:predicted nicotinamide N-methyase